MMFSITHVCDPCGKTFTGVEPYNQHLVSGKHLKKVAQAQQNSVPSVLENFITSPNTSVSTALSPVASPATNTSKYFCYVCNTAFRDIIEQLSHNQSGSHRENVKRAKEPHEGPLKTINVNPSISTLTSYIDMQSITGKQKGGDYYVWEQGSFVDFLRENKLEYQPDSLEEYSD